MLTPASSRSSRSNCPLAFAVALFAATLAAILCSAPPARARPNEVPGGAVVFNEHWYLVVLTSPDTTWRKAVDGATGKGGHLVCIETQEERDFINELLNPTPIRRFWLGGFREAGTRTWKWINGKTIDQKEIANPGKPGDDLRLRVMPEQTGRRWNAIEESPSEPMNGYVIEFPPGNNIALTLPDRMQMGQNSESKSKGSDKSSVKISGNEHAKPIELRKTQTRLKGLLVIPLGGDEHAGGASQMNLSALAGNPEDSATIGFNQPVGESMAAALKEVVKFIELRHDGWPRGRTIEIAFEDKYSGKDGPSAAVACALLLDSAIAGTELDPRFAVTGDLNADGAVQPIGGVRAKIRGATNRDCTHVALPEANATSVTDVILTDGFKSIAEIQVFSISTFDEARALASKEHPKDLAKAMESFAAIQNVYRRQPRSFAKSLEHPKVIEKLNEVLAAAPNHLSASIMLAHALGKAPPTLSLQGSVAFIDTTAFKMVDVIDNGKVAKIGAFDEHQVADAVGELKRMRLRLDQRTWKWADVLITYGTQLHEWQTNRPKSVNNQNKLVDSINAAGDRARAERKTLMSNKEVVEELDF